MVNQNWLKKNWKISLLIGIPIIVFIISLLITSTEPDYVFAIWPFDYDFYIYPLAIIWLILLIVETKIFTKVRTGRFIFIWLFLNTSMALFRLLFYSGNGKPVELTFSTFVWGSIGINLVQGTFYALNFLHTKRQQIVSAIVWLIIDASAFGIALGYTISSHYDDFYAFLIIGGILGLGFWVLFVRKLSVGWLSMLSFFFGMLAVSLIVFGEVGRCIRCTFGYIVVSSIAFAVISGVPIFIHQINSQVNSNVE